MGNNVKTNDVVLLLDNYFPDSEKLHQSFQLAGFDYPAVVIEDDGFLPDGIISVYGFFLGEFKGKKGVPGRPRYFNQITVPDYWEISGTNSSGKVHNLYRERGRIFYAEPKNKRYVRVVDWCDEEGRVRISDHYNRYGALYAKTVFNAKEQKVNKSYFSADGREILVENYVTGDIILNEGKEVKIFHSKTEFVLYVLKAAGYGNRRIFFNSLSTPFFVSQRMAENGKKDVLFWQEPVGEAIPGNMTIILDGQAARTAQIIVQKQQAYDRLLELGAPSSVIHRRGYVYPFRRENAHRPEALICTNSDQIEQCSKIVEAIPGMQFHIAALTEMSSKLMSMETYKNVKLYPGIKTEILDELFEQCDYYLDINHGGEIVSAVYRAFLENQLIFAFRETLHNPDCVAKEHIYPADEADKMIAEIKQAMNKKTVMNKQIKIQHEAAMVETKDSYSFASAD